MTNTVDPKGRAEWDAAAASAAQHEIDTGDQPPKKFREKLSCQLSQPERLQLGLRSADAANSSKERYEAAARDLAASRKKELAEEKILADAFRTGRIEKEVEVMEYTSLRLGRKWKVRQDTMESFDEKPLSGDERQARMPIDNGQMNLGDAARPEQDELEEEDDGEDDEDEDEEGDDEDNSDGDGGEVVDKPDDLLEAAERGDAAALLDEANAGETTTTDTKKKPRK